jgi:hypothetical protein
MESKCPRVYRPYFFLMTCLNMLLKFDHLVMECAVYSIGIPVQWRKKTVPVDSVALEQFFCKYFDFARTVNL